MILSSRFIGGSFVALLAEGVDRNPQLAEQGVVDDLSPSSRRAWIEIARRPSSARGSSQSPSSRRAWIEILEWNGADAAGLGSPSSRRAWIEIFNSKLIATMEESRPPRGGRG